MKRIWYVQGKICMYIKNVGLGLTPWGRPIGLKAVSQGVMLLLIPMVCGVKWKQTEEVCLCYVKVKRCVHKRNGYAQRNICT